MNTEISYVGLMALFTFLLSVSAATLAINLYSLYRTGRMGASWRVIIIATVMFALLQAVKLAELDISAVNALHLSSIIELAFVLLLLYAFHLQHQVFATEQRLRKDHDEGELEEPELEGTEAHVVTSYDRYS